MPGIFDLFDPPPEGQPSALEEAWTQIAGARDAATATGDPASTGGDSGGPAGEAGAAVPQGPSVDAAPPSAAPPQPATPFATIAPEERAELLLLRQALADPERARAVRQAYLGVPPAAAPPAPPAPPAPTLPEHIDPQSFEADLWRDNQALARQVAELRQQTERSTEDLRRDRWMAAANDAGERFAAKYSGRLTPTEIQAIAQIAGARGLPQALSEAYQGDVGRACTDALEFVLRQTDALLAKALTPPQAPGVQETPPAPAPGTQPLYPGQPVSQDPAALAAQAAEYRKRTLTALSAGSSPVGEAPTRTPLETRGATGRLTEASRRSLVDQMAAVLKTEG